MVKEQKKKRIRPTDIENFSESINPTQIGEQIPISFNFKRLYEKEDKFCYSTKETGYFLKLIQRLKDISGLTRKEMMNNWKGLRFHQIDFFNAKQLTEKSFGILCEDVDNDAWQFQLSSNEHGRVHGYFVANVFYIVWLDPNHELY